MRWLKRGVITLLVLANLGVFYLYWQLRNVEQVVAEAAATIPEVVPQLTPTMPDAGEPITFLVVGSDSRENLEDLTGFGQAGGHRSDVIMLVKIHPGEDRAQILSIPRDLWVEIPGEGEGKINAAYAVGGAPLLVQTVKGVTGVEVNHYVEVDFVGFQAIVDQLGGVTMEFPFAARDSKSDLQVEAGTQRLDGAMALAYARSRNYQELRDGQWVGVAADDFGRTQRQQRLILAILDELKRPSTLTEAGEIVGAFARHLSMDAALAESSLIELAFRMRGISSERIETVTLPAEVGTAGQASVAFLKEPEASAVLAAFRRGDPIETTLEAGPLHLQVLNGNGVAGSAHHWSEVLEAEGFDIVGIGDADRTDYPETVVLVRPGEEDRVLTLIETLGFGRIDVGALDPGLDAVVYLGSDAAVFADG